MSEERTHSVHCAATGCPAAGVMSRSTTGGGEFWCQYHFSAEPNRIHEVTAELVRLRWLVQLCKGIRHDINTGIWTEAAAQGYKEIALHQRSDLYRRASTTTKREETTQQWLYRLEKELSNATAEPRPAAPIQQPLNV